MNIKHRLVNHPLYRVWVKMKERCYYDKDIGYANYGGRGITVCSEWKDNFKNFYDWAVDKWKKGLYIDRINNDGNYEPDNCRFVTPKVSALNKRVLKSNISGHTGITIHKPSNKWMASISINSTLKYIGLYFTIEEAVNARNAFIISNNLDYKIINYDFTNTQ